MGVEEDLVEVPGAIGVATLPGNTATELLGGAGANVRWWAG
jgi:hypothetical protein